MAISTVSQPLSRAAQARQALSAGMQPHARHAQKDKVRCSNYAGIRLRTTITRCLTCGGQLIGVDQDVARSGQRR